MAAVLDAVVSAMAAAGYPERDVFCMRLGLEEALANALKHGHGGEPGKRVRVRYRVGPGRTLARVQDQGPGFDPGAVPDPLAPENLEKPCGRGLLLMRSYLTWCRFNPKGNRVTLCQSRSGR
jgi:serine/threonine-protein kinase RsbW